MKRMISVGAVCALLVAACGDDGEETVTTGATTAGGETTQADETTPGDTTTGDSGPDDEALIEEAIVAVLTDPDESVCEEFHSDRFLTASYGDLAGCAAGRPPEALAKGVGPLQKLEIDGDTATATVIPERGVYDGAKVMVEFVRDGDHWQVDALVADLPVGP